MKNLICTLFLTLSSGLVSAQVPVELKINPLNVNTGQTFEVPVLVNSFTDVTSFSFSITWDTTKLKFIEVTNLSTSLPLASSQVYTPNIALGKLWVVWLDLIPKSLPNNSVILGIKFKAVAPGLTPVRFVEDPVEVSFIGSNGQIINQTITDGQIIINQSSSGINTLDLKSFMLHPNPTSNTTEVKFSLEKTQAIKLLVFDATGLLVQSREIGKMVAGDHRILLEASQLNSGLFHVVLQGNEGVAQAQWVILK